MPSPTYKQNKTHIYKWREKNIEKLREINKKSKQRYDMFKKEQKRLFCILLE